MSWGTKGYSLYYTIATERVTEQTEPDSHTHTEQHYMVDWAA